MTFSYPWPLDHRYTSQPSCLLPVKRLQDRNISQLLHRTLDRVNVLGDDARYGHQGCVNAITWAENGNLLLTGSDDTTVRLWRVDSANLKQEYPYVCRSVISTGHRANIFNVQMLPYSKRIVTCAGDRQIRILDATTALEVKDGLQTEFGARDVSAKVIMCHTDRVKKLVTEDSPDIFLSLGEDGTVRQHDLRAPHHCRGRECPALLLQMPHELSTLSMSPIAPHQFVVAGDSPYGYLYDRRYVARNLRQEWGEVPRIGEGVTSCVRRFGRPPRAPGDASQRRAPHITGSRISSFNGHEVLLTYSSDKVYLFSTRDEPQLREDMSTPSKAQLSPNSAQGEQKVVDTQSATPPGPVSMEVDVSRHNPDQSHREGNGEDGASDRDENEEDEGDEDDEERTMSFLDLLLQGTSGSDPDLDVDSEDFLDDVPIILPRSSYAGARNVETVKDVNFLGPNDEFVVSGSDDGNWFMWDKVTGRLEGIYEGDGSVVNVVECHPRLPLVAVSGIDHTVKLFTLARGKSAFSRMDNAEAITEANARSSGRRVVTSFARLLARTALAAERRGEEDSEGITVPIANCPTQ